MFMMKKRWILILVTLLFAFVVFGCGGDDVTGPDDEGEFKGEVKIGILVPTTGSEAGDGKDMENAILLAIDEINAAGGLLGYKVVAVTGDDQCDPEAAAAAAALHVSQDVIAVVGGYCSGATIATLAVYGEAGIPLVIAASNATRLIDENVGTGLWAFMINSTGDAQAAKAVEWFEQNGIKTIGLVDDGGAFAADLKEQTVAQWTEKGFEVIIDDTVQVGEIDFSALVTRVIAANPDGFYWTGYQAEGGPLVRQLREGGYKGMIIVGDGSSSNEILELAGPIADGIFCTAPPVVDFLPAAADFIRGYEATFPREPGAYAGLAYDAANLLFDAIKRAGSFDRTAIKDALAATQQFDGITGPVVFTPQNTLDRSNFVILEAVNERWTLAQ